MDGENTYPSKEHIFLMTGIMLDQHTSFRRLPFFLLVFMQLTMKSFRYGNSQQTQCHWETRFPSQILGWENHEFPTPRLLIKSFSSPQSKYPQIEPKPLAQPSSPLPPTDTTALPLLSLLRFPLRL